MAGDGIGGEIVDSSKKDEDADYSSDVDDESFTESRWNAQKASQPIHTRSESEVATMKTKEPADLLEKRIYQLAQPLHEESTVDTATDNVNVSEAQHSAVEQAVILDFLSKNFLLEHLDTDRQTDLLSAFQRLKATKHEGQYSVGTLVVDQ